jgi:adenylate cyclase
VIGEAVNVSWKLQELTKELGTELIVGENVMSLVIEEFELRPLGKASINGLPQRLEIYEVLGAIEPETANLRAALL